MDKIKNAYNVIVEKLWPLTGSLSEELIILIAAFFLSPILEHGVVVTWIYIWGAIAIIRIAVFGDAIKDRVE